MSKNKKINVEGKEINIILDNEKEWGMYILQKMEM